MTDERTGRDEELGKLMTVGRTLRYRREEVEQWLADQRERRS